MVLAHPDGYRVLHGSQTALIAAIRVRHRPAPGHRPADGWSEPLRKSRERLQATPT